MSQPATLFAPVAHPSLPPVVSSAAIPIGRGVLHFSVESVLTEPATDRWGFDLWRVRLTSRAAAVTHIAPASAAIEIDHCTPVCNRVVPRLNARLSDLRTATLRSMGEDAWRYSMPQGPSPLDVLSHMAVCVVMVTEMPADPAAAVEWAMEECGAVRRAEALELCASLNTLADGVARLLDGSGATLADFAAFCTSLAGPPFESLEDMAEAVH